MIESINSPVEVSVTMDDSFDWSRFHPTERAVIAFALRDGQILLIHKQRGLGAGKINGPGGRIEPGESARDAAIRETREEVGIDLADPTERATLHFAFRDGYLLTVYVFLARAFSGEPVETEEAIPFWVALDAVPYDRMWADDEHWLPLVLDGAYVEGRFEFDGDSMLWKELRTRPAL